MFFKVLQGSPRFFKVFSGRLEGSSWRLWRSLRVLECSWWFFRVLEGSWRFLKVLEGSWSVLYVFEMTYHFDKNNGESGILPIIWYHTDTDTRYPYHYCYWFISSYMGIGQTLLHIVNFVCIYILIAISMSIISFAHRALLLMKQIVHNYSSIIIEVNKPTCYT